MIIDNKNHGIIHEERYEDIIVEANQFLTSAEILFNNWKYQEQFPPEPLTFPAITCFGFSCELYIKGITLKYNNSFLRTHNLETLFFQLPEQIQAKVVNMTSCNSFNQELKSVSNIFEEIRYIFDTEKYGRKTPNINFIQSFAKTLNQVANAEIIKKVIEE